VRQRIRGPLLALHVIVSVGWIGAAMAYLALGLAAELSDQTATIRASWLGMELVGWLVLVPLGALAWLSGIGLCLVTRWGLLRHYWVIFAWALTTPALIVMLLHMATVTAESTVARSGDTAAVDRLGGDVAHPGLGLLILMVIAILNLYKPRGLTPYGRRGPSTVVGPRESPRPSP
jgi:hypothetical protein